MVRRLLPGRECVRGLGAGLPTPGTSRATLAPAPLRRWSRDFSGIITVLGASPEEDSSLGLQGAPHRANHRRNGAPPLCPPPVTTTAEGIRQPSQLPHVTQRSRLPAVTHLSPSLRPSTIQPAGSSFFRHHRALLAACSDQKRRRFPLRRREGRRAVAPCLAVVLAFSRRHKSHGRSLNKVARMVAERRTRLRAASCEPCAQESGVRRRQVDQRGWVVITCLATKGTI